MMIFTFSWSEVASLTVLQTTFAFIFHSIGYIFLLRVLPNT